MLRKTFFALMIPLWFTRGTSNHVWKIHPNRACARSVCLPRPSTKGTCHETQSLSHANIDECKALCSRIPTCKGFTKTAISCNMGLCEDFELYGNNNIDYHERVELIDYQDHKLGIAFAEFSTKPDPKKERHVIGVVHQMKKSWIKYDRG